MDSYDWLPTECAYEKFPMQILEGNLICGDDIIGIPDGRIIYNGWGRIGSTHIVGERLKPLPGKINITWFSFTEDKFYSGEFDLPVVKINELFREGYIEPASGKKMSYNNILVGLAPHGGLAIWVMGEGNVRQVAFFNVHEANVSWEKFTGSNDVDRKSYIYRKLDQVFTPNNFTELRNNGVPDRQWYERFRTLYNWHFVPSGGIQERKVSVKYFNGESEEFISNSFKKQDLAVPKQIVLKWTGKSGTDYVSVLDFNEQEIFNAFNQLNTGSELTLEVEISNIDKSLKIFIRNQKFIIELKKAAKRTFAE